LDRGSLNFLRRIVELRCQKRTERLVRNSNFGKRPSRRVADAWILVFAKRLQEPRNGWRRLLAQAAQRTRGGLPLRSLGMIQLSDPGRDWIGWRRLDEGHLRPWVAAGRDEREQNGNRERRGPGSREQCGCMLCAYLKKCRRGEFHCGLVVS